MPNSFFQFKQFTVWHDRCAMKVGTDGVLLGAVAGSRCRAAMPRSILDVGTGTGLIALMMAQSCPDAEVVGIDIDEEACRQAAENVMVSPFPERVAICHSSLEDYAPGALYDAVVCNPPFYEEMLLCPDSQRNAARHTTSLPFSELAYAVARLLMPGGYFFVIVPASAMDRIEEACAYNGLSVLYRLYIRTVERKAPKRVILQMVKGCSPECGAMTETRCLMEDGQRSRWYAEMCKDFYL